jgi:uncharacterized protein YecT (DUF1311 family)
MKSRFVLIMALAFTTQVSAEPDEAVVLEMARQTHLTPGEIRLNYDACGSGVTLTMKICASYRWRVEDSRLNQIYKQALAKARESGYEASLIRAQRAWVAFRDAACTYEGEIGAGGGTAEGLYVLSCKENLTKQRADRLVAVLGE